MARNSLYRPSAITATKESVGQHGHWKLIETRHQKKRRIQTSIFIGI
jgi:hypothetical protein